MDDADGFPFHYSQSTRVNARLDRDAERSNRARHVTLIPKVEETDPRTLFDVIDPKLVVATLRESLTACLTTAAGRDGITLTTEQIERFCREMANNAAGVLMLQEIE